MLLLKEHHIHKGSKGLNKLFYYFNEWFGRVTGHYANGGKGLDQTGAACHRLIGRYCVGDYLLFSKKPTGFIPTEDDGRCIFPFEIPEAGSTTRAITVLDSIQHIAQNVPGVLHTAALGGLNILTFGTKSNAGSIFMQFKPWDERKKKSEQLYGIIAELQKRFASIKGARIVVIPPPAIPGLGNAGGFSIQIEQRQSNDDIKTFERVVNQFVAEANKQPEIGNAFTFFSAPYAGISGGCGPGQGQEAGSEPGRRLQYHVDVHGQLLYQPVDHLWSKLLCGGAGGYQLSRRCAFIDKYYVKNVNGQMIQLSTVLSYKQTESAPLISHFNIYRSAEIDGGAKQGFSSDQANQALLRVAAKVLPEGYG